MRKYETVKEVVEKERVVERTCDLCGAKAKPLGWECGCYEVQDADVEVTIHRKKGEAYPEGGYGTTIIVDICPKCFDDKLIPFLRAQGADIKESIWEY